MGASFGGLTPIFNGKAWPKAMRAFRMVVSALLYDFLEEGEKTHEQITAFLSKAREHPTGRLWVDCFIIPTMIALRFWRAEREGDWLLQHSTALERCCPISLPPVITTMQDGSPGISVTFHTFLLQPKMTSPEAMCAATQMVQLQ